MSKWIYSFLLILLVSLAACSTSNGSNTGGTENSQPKVRGVKDVDVLNSHGSVEGLNRLSQFYTDVQEGVTSDLRIVHYTIEGDPMVTDLAYDGESLEITDDTTRDNYGEGSIRSISCGDLKKEINPTNTSYIAIDCDNARYELFNILEISYNMGQQDRFDFVLQYGPDLDNEISTLTDHSKLPDSVKQEVYKRLVFANYLDEKVFKNTCTTEEATNYYLQVYINGGERNFRFASCGETEDSLNFTKIATYIVEQSETSHPEEPKTVQGYVLEVKDNSILIGEDFNRLDYHSIKDTLKENELSVFALDFVYLEGLNEEEFQLGDKIHATIDGEIIGSQPGRATMKEIAKIEASE
ncbi:DUF4362 domain-containing protein [Radiobacillus sp. PE A8.2]|uniref:DUF4362 domain-containing protein n=1 Tax=Radiobacillus sp. PE A8.2 TaxID=3380349 RepID=UPI003890916F